MRKRNSPQGLSPYRRDAGDLVDLDGVLVVDKPQGVTSHDVVAGARRLLGVSRIGHTGTLDPLATGVLPLTIGRATRLVRFLVAADKEYNATIRFGLTTDTYDITGAETSRSDQVPTRDAVLTALPSLTGQYLQRPPAYSAKKVEGRRAYHLARQDRTAALAPVPVNVARVELLDYVDGRARVALTCSAGFYVRSFAHALGEIVGTGACLEALRRTRSGEFRIGDALPLESLRDPAQVNASLVPCSALLVHLPAVTVTARGREHVSHGRELGADDYSSGDIDWATEEPAWVRLFDSGGALIGLATAGLSPGSLHPSLVLM